MAFRKPPLQNEPLVNALLERGGSTPTNRRPIGPRSRYVLKERVQCIQMRVKQGLVDRVDRLLKHQPVYMSRHEWILEAMREKLARDTPPTQLPREALNGTPVATEDQE